ncbi:uncharacterized protein K441DRAFT_708409 [Cenococcum geophilum 1.58]|uniref:uncharacterized protein n=1 Tax=Cenococcum geophilum 1.58 TaxID=794803 RepID=UPI00358F7527|nr:hypothetical protein K441DRAFT_708409 [Cenococcum geophilum 1.58]
MGRRQRLISKSILNAIFRSSDKPSNRPHTILARILAFFSISCLALSRYKAELFKMFCNEIWGIDEDEYRESFWSASKRETFFTIPISKYLLKSLPRGFEQGFFKGRLLPSYSTHMAQYPNSLFVRITDLLYTRLRSLGAILGTAPSHHIETHHLKPIDYSYPERDIAGGALAPKSVKKRLVDKSEDKVRVSIEEEEDLVGMLVQDTKILREANAVDYSLFLPLGRTSPWRSGIMSRDGKWVYRAVLLDFFWAKDALRAKALTGLGDGSMNIIATATEYRERFLKMIEAIVEAEA